MSVKKVFLKAKVARLYNSMSPKQGRGSTIGKTSPATYETGNFIGAKLKPSEASMAVKYVKKANVPSATDVSI